MKTEQFVCELQKNHIKISDRQLMQFQRYYEILVEWNQKMNLTAITEQEEVYEKHFFDSITPTFYYDFTQVKTMCDVGAGAGFPSIPIKILFPHLELTIVDSLNKRITFLKYLAEDLKLDNCNFVHDRAENFGQNLKYREKFDLVSARAVAKLSVLGEFCLPLVKVNGLFIALKGNAAESEWNEAKEGVSKLGGKLQKSNQLELPVEKSQRQLIFIQKENSTPKKYPRKPGLAAKNPL